MQKPDFVEICAKIRTKSKMVIKPQYSLEHRSDLMTRGRDFYAIWDEEAGFWRTDERYVVRTIDNLIKQKYDEMMKSRLAYDDLDNQFNKPSLTNNQPYSIEPLYLDWSDTNSIDEFHRYCQCQLRDDYHTLDSTIRFKNSKLTKEDYCTKTLPYSMEPGNIDGYNELMDTLYDPQEREKLEWAIGSIISGDSKYIQKFIVLYGEPGSGKSTFLNIVQKLFEGYYCSFNAKSIGSANDQFALEAFKSNPLIAIQHDGDLSRIEDNTRLNSLVSHEVMEMNEKHRPKYQQRFNAFLFMGTNVPVKISDAKSGILRRLIDVYPSGRTVPRRRYDQLISEIDFQLGAIAQHCLDVYTNLGASYYDGYIPVNMISATNDFYNFVDYYFEEFSTKEFTALTDAWSMYKTYCDFANVSYPMSMRSMKNEFKNYFNDFQERYFYEGRYYRNVYLNFKSDKFIKKQIEAPKEYDGWLKLSEPSHESVFDIICANEPAQLANDNGSPVIKWEYVHGTLKDMDPKKLHYVLMTNPNHIVIDFDLKDENGKKSLERNLKAANMFPPTYSELSKSGSGIHLHYIYNGDVSKLSRIYSEDIEIKVFNGKSSLRRKLSLCNNLPIATISSGLPLKEDKKVAVDQDVIKSELGIRRMIEKNLRKEIHGATKPSVDFIYKILEDAYNSDISYDVEDLKNRVIFFASCSTHQSEKCLELVTKMHFKSKDAENKEELYSPPDESKPIAFYDIEVFPNLFLVNWKLDGPEHKCVRMINPSPSDISKLVNNYRLIGFNCRRYDNHVMYARMQNYSIEQLYHLSQKLVTEKDKGVQGTAMFANAYNLSYTDIYDFMSEKQSLKKWEIALGIHHKELGLPWDEPVPEERWEEVALYCDNDVLATEALFHSDDCQADFLARQVIAELSGLTVNHTTNAHSTRIIFGTEKKPQAEFVYTDLATIFPGYKFGFEKFEGPNGKQITRKVSSYREVKEVGEGGYVSALPGIYENVWVFDVASMHPSSIIALNLFGDRYTKVFADLVSVRKHIKHGELKEAGELFDGKLKPYLKDPKQAKRLSQALKIVINSVYGLTSASFDNPFRDVRNADNIVAKRGALFMIELQHELKEKFGVDAIHIKTDSIKIQNPSEKVKKFIYDFGLKYGYEFEVEHIYQKFCLVNDAVYIAKLEEPEKDKKTGEDIWWDATGAQFKQPYVYKTLFSKQPLIFRDVCETKQVKTAIYLDMNEDLPEDEHNYVFVGKVGLFCPMKNGCGAGIMVAEREDKKTGEKKYQAVTGTKGYRWLESELVEGKLENEVDHSYYISLVDEAVKTISEYGDFEAFAV